MNINMKKILLILFLLISITANANKVYIATAANGGNNANPGTLAQPWLTLAYACTQAVAGDTIMVGVGTFTETAQATVAVGVSIMGAGVTSVINSTYSVTGQRPIVLSSATLTNGSQSISYIKLTGSNFTARNGISVQRRSNVTIHHCTIENFIYTGVVFIYPNAENEPNPIYCTGNKFHDNIVTNCSGYIEGSGTYPALGIDGQDGMLVYSNVFTEAKTLGDRGIPIKGVIGINKNVKIYDNEVYMTTYTDGDHWDFAIEMWDYRGGIEIYNNYLEGSIDIGGYNNFASGDTYYSVWIHDNTILQTEQALSENTRGIIIEGALRSEDIIIERNYIKNTCRGIAITSYTANAVFKNIRISYNIFESLGLADSEAVNSKGWGISWRGDDAVVITQTSDNFEVCNNIFTAKVGTYSTMWGLALPACVSTNTKYRNNIVLNFDYAGIYGSDWGKALTCDILSIENNIFYGNGYSNLPRYSGITPTNNTTQNNIIDDPLFVGGSPYDYNLQATSPAINAGLDVGLSYDYDDKPIYLTPDIGALEQQTFPASSGLGWKPKYFKENVRDTLNIDKGLKIKGEPVITSARTLNKLDGLISTASQINHVTDHFVAGDTTVTARVGKIVYQAADSSFYGCRSTVAPKKWYKLNE